ncbi:MULTISPECIES: aminotransferase class III-fold pyridoxal phosphate-dependent enzyme [unclassified Streptomyces]|uniref:aminotransferase class III-fold pyridoxal phosphate-dependent enzyme n=1 Tax=unclassified Streptomyces TaxID=2593676 RepID=UPI0038165862
MSAPVSSRLTEAELDQLQRSQSMHYNHYGRPPLPFACLGARGIALEAVGLAGPRRGETFTLFDASGGYGSACLGAGHDSVRRSLRRAVADTGYVTDEIASRERAALLDHLFGAQGLWQDHFPADAYHVAGRNSGSEGLELALRLILESRFDPRRLRHRPGREKRDTILAFEGAWHGWTHGLLPFLNRRHYRVGLPGPAAEQDYGLRVDHIPFGDPGALEEYFAANSERLLAVFVEPVQGDAGILLPPPGYLRSLSGMCADNATWLVADEVLTFAKTGRWFGMRDADGPVPTDITVIGKSLGMGALSTSMVIARRELRARATGTISTSDLRPLTCAVMHDGIDHLVRAGLLEHSARLGVRLTGTLRSELVRRFPDAYTHSRGLGVMHGVELSGTAAARLDSLRTHLLTAGVYVEFMAGAGKRSRGLRYVYPTMRIAPPLITTEAEADEIVERLGEGTRRFLETL